MKQQLVELMEKIEVAEDFVRRAEDFFAEKQDDWSFEAAISFEKFLERKREQIYLDQSLAEKMAWKIALEQDDGQPDI